ncbi:protein moonraker isoform X2 [Cuculus canorus]|uniref:protein moonraker isoform X2 n=1 Tax=Cuculus canorus TaxID=55661 RepID=UPI0023AB396B|nr:protein moonraker isoform X2 [Cuculus canorus]
MGPRKPTTTDAAFAFPTQLHGNRAQALQTQLQFNRNVPAVPENLALRFSHPRPIIIEKLKASNDRRNLTGSEDLSVRSSGMFSVVSEERLKLAVQLAKKDIKRRHLEEQVKQQVVGDAVNKPLLAQKSQQQETEVFESPGNKNARKSQTRLKDLQKLSQPSRLETTSSGAKVYLYTPNRKKLIPKKVMPAVSDSPPTRDTGPDPRSSVSNKEDKNLQEVRRLQKELRSCVQKIEDLTKKGKEREILDPDTEQRVRIRRQEQAARSARMLYALQQQVKEIQDDLEKLSPHKVKHTKKSRAASRLAAAHRGAVRALQAFASQFTDQTEQQIPTHYKELGSLIRQLSLCSARLEVDSSISDIIIDILMQVEDLDSLLEKKQTSKKVKKCISASQEKSPRNLETFLARKQLNSPEGENKHLVLKEQGQECRKSPAARSLLPDKHQHVANISAVQKANSCAYVFHNKFREENALPAPKRNAALQGGLNELVRPRAVKNILESGPLKKKGVLLPAKSQGKLKSRQIRPRGKRARFQETTISFQLKENKRLVKESRIPCVPLDPTSLPASPERLAQLEAGTSRGVKVLTDLSKGEMKNIQNLRSQSASPTRYPDKVEKAAREHLEPPVDRTQVAANADILTEKLLDDLLEDTAQELWSIEQRESLQMEALPVADMHSLESMLQRMEEIERYQEAVRRRFTQIVYSDLEFWDQEHKKEQQMASIAERPTSPHPIQMTKLIGRTEPEVDILLEKPLDGNDIDENEEAEEKLQTGNDILQPLTRNSLQKGCCVSLSVPKHMLQSILDYNSRYKHHLKLISHEAVGSFDPWQIAESLAEQLIEEALCDVAAELQDVCEDYAEAVFTSEFLQPAL